MAHGSPQESIRQGSSRPGAELKKAFDEEGIEIPFPHVVLVTRGAKATDVGEGGVRLDRRVSITKGARKCQEIWGHALEALRRPQQSY
jgi:hypothetical protein